MGFVPTNSELALSMLIISAIGWGSAFVTIKKCGNWRFESWYIFYMIGSFLFVFLYSVTLGMLGSSTFLENLTTSNFFHRIYALLSGIVWNLGNILLVAAIAIAGFGLGFPVTIGLALLLGSTLSYFVNPTGNPFLLFLGVSLIFTAIIFNSLSYQLKGTAIQQKSKVRKGILISIIAGILIGLYPFLLSLGLVPKGTLDGYSVVFLFTLGGFLSTFPYIYGFMKKPITGERDIGLEEIRRAKFSWYFWGLLAGLIWATATVFNFVSASVVSVAIAYSLGLSAPMISAIWGIFVFKELKGAPKKSWFLISLMFLFFILGIASIALSFR